MEKLQPVSALRRRLLSSDAVATWERLSARWRLVSIVLALALLAALAVAGVLLFGSKEWGAKLAGIAAGVAVLYAAYQVRLTRVLSKQTLAYKYFERFSRYSLEQPYATAKAFVFPPPANKAEAQRRWEEFKEWERENSSRVRDVMFIFNFFEELGGVYRRRVVDHCVIDEYLGKFALEFWSQLHWFICRIRKDRTATLFEDWEAMCKAVERAKRLHDQWR
jgi:hypothetical protein